MYRIVLILTSILMTTSLIAQDFEDKQNMEVVTDQEAHYPKGEQALYQEMFSNIKYSEEAKTNKAEGQVMVSFNVYPDGSIKDVVIINGIGFGIDEEIKRILMTLKFAPHITNGMAIKSNQMFNFPVRAH